MLNDKISHARNRKTVAASGGSAGCVVSHFAARMAAQAVRQLRSAWAAKARFVNASRRGEMYRAHARCAAAGVNRDDHEIQKSS